MRKIFRLLLWLITAPFRFLFWLLSFGDIRDAMSKPVEEDATLGDVVDKVIENPGGIVEHLVVLRRHLIRSVVLLACTTGASFLFIHRILEFLAQPIEGGLSSLVAIEVTEPIGTVMRVSLLSGFAIAFPYIAYQVWLFVAPAMIDRRNRIYSLFAIPIATIFFLGGMSFAYFVMLPVALPFLLNFMGISTIPRPSNYITFVTGIMFWIGIAFEFPLVIYLLARLGVIKPDMLTDQWRLAIVLIFVVAAFITPTVDPVNMSLVAGPMILLYFLSILLAKIAHRSRLRRAAI